jgi:hypothetical protein
MSGKSRSDIINDIEAHIQKGGSNFAEWYVGVAASPKNNLFKVHKLRQTGDAWIARHAFDHAQAAEVAEYFVTSRHTKGRYRDSKPGDEYVYAYKMKPHTTP